MTILNFHFDLQTLYAGREALEGWCWMAVTETGGSISKLNVLISTFIIIYPINRLVIAICFVI